MSRSYIIVFSVVCFVDIGGIDDHHCLNFLFIICSQEHLTFKDDKLSYTDFWGRGRMVVGFKTTCAISAYHH
jgi:hypothetical protein